jgi:hypothetical protein
MATSGLTRELRRVDWQAAAWRASLLCLPAIAIGLIGGLATGHRFAALVIAGSAQSVGFGAFQRKLWFRGGPMVILSGVAELAGAAGLFIRLTERIASLCIALLMIAIFPANIHVAGQTVHGMYMPAVPARLLMQMIYIVLVLAAGWGRPVL